MKIPIECEAGAWQFDLQDLLNNSNKPQSWIKVK